MGIGEADFTDLFDFLNSLSPLKIKCDYINKCPLIKAYKSNSRTDVIVDNIIPQYCSEENGGNCPLAKDYNKK